jgi:hypothetical protein
VVRVWYTLDTDHQSYEENAMPSDYPDWTTLYIPEEHMGEASAEVLCLWLKDKIYEYGEMASGMTDALCLDATHRLLQWVREGGAERGG